MPRQARIDTPGALHHIIIRETERKKIFNDDSDRDDFSSGWDPFYPNAEPGVRHECIWTLEKQGRKFD